MTRGTFLRGARVTLAAAVAITMASALSVPAFAAATPPTNGPASVADLAEKLLGAVVNISTSQTVKGTEGPGAVPMPQLPEGSPSRISSTTSSRIAAATMTAPARRCSRSVPASSSMRSKASW